MDKRRRRTETRGRKTPHSRGPPPTAELKRGRHTPTFCTSTSRTPKSAATQLGLTPEEAAEAHEECLCAQQEIRKEIEEEDRVAHERRAGQDVHEAYNVPDDANTLAALTEHNGEYGDVTDRAELERNTFEPLQHELIVPNDGGGNWAEDGMEGIHYTIQGEYRPTNYSQQPAPPSPAP